MQTTTYSFRFGEVHLDKAVVGCFIVCLYDELVSLIGDVLRRDIRDRRKRGKETEGEGWEGEGGEEREGVTDYIRSVDAVTSDMYACAYVV